MSEYDMNLSEYVWIYNKRLGSESLTEYIAQGHSKS